MKKSGDLHRLNNGFCFGLGLAMGIVITALAMTFAPMLQNLP